MLDGGKWVDLVWCSPCRRTTAAPQPAQLSHPLAVDAVDSERYDASVTATLDRTLERLRREASGDVALADALELLAADDDLDDPFDPAPGSLLHAAHNQRPAATASAHPR